MKYLVRVSELRYGTVEVEANSEEEAKTIATGKEVDFFEEEITDMTAEPVLESGEKDFPVFPLIKPIHLTVENIDDIMVSALEGGITYWCGEAEVVEDKRVAEWGHEQIARGGMLILHDIESDDKWELTLEKFLKGFKLWLDNGGDEYGAVSGGEVDCGDIDAGCADEIIQYALFGEVVFG